MMNMCPEEYERLFNMHLALRLKYLADELDFDIQQAVTSFEGILSLHYANKLEVAVPDKVRNAILTASSSSKYEKKFKQDVMQGYLDHIYQTFGMKGVWSANLDVLYLNI